MASDSAWVVEVVSSLWGNPLIVSRGRGHLVHELPGIVAEREGIRVGLLTYRLTETELEVVTLQALEPRSGVGSALLRAAERAARQSRCRRLWLVTTNDNTIAVRFYTRLGMRLVAVHKGALAESRRLKPEIPFLSADGIPIEDELEFELRVSET